MTTVGGIFVSRASARRAIESLRAQGIDEDRMVLLSPGASDEDVEQTVPVIDSGEAGTAEKIGSSVGRGTGIAGGILFGGAVGSVFVPGIGAVLAAGVLGAAVLGTMGAALGAAAGSAVDEKAAASLRDDELHLYEAALRQGRSIVIAVAIDESEAQLARQTLVDNGAETLDQARENWWSGLRAAEEEAYKRDGSDFTVDEKLYRRGFEAALHPRARGQTFVDNSSFLREYFREDHETDAFRRGYERGQMYQKHLMDKFPPS